MKRLNRHVLPVVLGGLLLFSAGRMTSAIDLGDILKVGGIGFLVKQFAKPLNDFVNTLMMNHGAENKDATKVVPILSLGKGGYVGAAQVIGKKVDVDRVEAVAQVEGDFSGRRFRVKGLIPIDTEKATSFHRVYNVGVSAVIDVKI